MLLDGANSENMGGRPWGLCWLFYSWFTILGSPFVAQLEINMLFCLHKFLYKVTPPA